LEARDSFFEFCIGEGRAGGQMPTLVFVQARVTTIFDTLALALDLKDLALSAKLTLAYIDTLILEEFEGKT
jgi:hypothetical protein